MKSIKELVEIKRNFETRKLKKQKKWEAEFDKEYKRIMKEVYADRRRNVRNSCTCK